MPRFRSPPLYLQTIGAMLLGGALGLWVGPGIAPIGVVAKWIIELIKLMALPLLFLAIFDALAQHAFRGRGIATMFGVSVFNALCAVSIGLALSNGLHPGQWLDLTAIDTAQATGKALTVADTSPAHVVRLVLQSPMVAAIVLALVAGIAFQVGHARAPAWRPRLDGLAATAHRGLQVVTRAMVWVVHLTPLAVFASVAKILGLHGFKLAGGLAVYVAVCLAGMALHIALVYHGWVVGAARIGVRRFWRAVREPVVYAFGINSSLATLPVTLKALNDLGVSTGSSRLSACVGTNFNNDGILLYEVVAVLFLSQAYGHDLGLAEQLLTAVICVAATVGVGGIPEAGIISLALVLGAVGLPAEAIPLLLSVDWLVARCRSAVNVLGDVSVAVAIDVVQGRKVVAGVVEREAG